MAKAGFIKPPVVRSGDRYVHGLKLVEVAQMLDVDAPDEARLSPEELYAKLSEILDRSEQTVRGFPAGRSR